VKPTQLSVDAIRTDGGTQSRESLDPAVIGEYAATLGLLPPVTVFFDGSDHWLADGFHRVEAANQSGAKRIPADIRQGTRRDAILYACGANAAHGLRRTNADKRRAVEVLLRDEEWSQWTDRKIATAVGVSHTFVAELRRPAKSLDTAAQQSGNVATDVGSENRMPVPAKVAADGGGQVTQAGGDEGAGVEAAANVVVGASDNAKAPAPYEPAPTGLVHVERRIRDAQDALAPLIISGVPLAMRLQAQLNDALATVARMAKGEQEPKTPTVATVRPAPAAIKPMPKVDHHARNTILIETPEGDVPFVDVPDPTDADAPPEPDTGADW
jgi:ParB-like chromosome segregation protein Spo0J